jgi:hypothetical protein
MAKNSPTSGWLVSLENLAAYKKKKPAAKCPEVH